MDHYTLAQQEEWAAEYLDSMPPDEQDRMLMDLMWDNVDPYTICGCTVEPDGRCPHGNLSIMLLLGVI